MAVQLSNEQKEFQETLRTFLAEVCPSDYVRGRINSGCKRDENFLTKLGTLGLNDYFDDKQSGASAIDLWLIAFESSRALLPEHTALEILCGPYARNAGIESDKGFLTVLDTKSAKNFSISSETISSGAKQLSGLFHHVPTYTDAVGAFVLGLGEEEVFYCDLAAAAQSREPALDIGRSFSSIVLRNVAAKPLSPNIALKIRSLIRVIGAAEIAGACSSAVNLTVSYAKQREQFGVPIGGFQTVQHKIADMHVQTEAIRALSLFAAWTVDNAVTQMPFAALSAAALAADSGSAVIESAIQVHGGIGFTWEYDLHLYLRRVRQLAAGLGGSELHTTQILAYAGGDFVA